MVEWHQLNEYEFEQIMGDGERQESLASYSLRGRKELDMTERLNNNTQNPQHTWYSMVKHWTLFTKLGGLTFPDFSVYYSYSKSQQLGTDIRTMKQNREPRDKQQGTNILRFHLYGVLRLVGFQRGRNSGYQGFGESIMVQSNESTHPCLFLDLKGKVELPLRTCKNG